MTKRSSAIYFAKQAYDAWVYRGHQLNGFYKVAKASRTDDTCYTFTHENGYRVILKRNGAVNATATKEANQPQPMKGNTVTKWKANFCKEGQETEFNLVTGGSVVDASKEAQAMNLHEYEYFELILVATGDVAYTGDIVKPEPKQEETPKGETVEFEMTWQAASGIIAAGLENGTFEGVKMGRQELAKMALAADQAVKVAKELQEAQAALETAQGRIERYEQENRDRMSDHKLWQEAKGLAKDIADEFRDELADDETLHDKEDEMRERAWETADGSQYVIYTHHALSICANCNTDNGEALLEELGMGENVTFDGLATRIAFGELYERINSELADILESEDE